MKLIRLAAYGRFLGSRFTGKEIRQEIEQALAAQVPVRLDFGGVESITESFADELLGVLTARQGPDVLCRLGLSGFNAAVAETFRFVLEELQRPGAPSGWVESLRHYIDSAFQEEKAMGEGDACREVHARIHFQDSPFVQHWETAPIGQQPAENTKYVWAPPLLRSPNIQPSQSKGGERR